MQQLVLLALEQSLVEFHNHRVLVGLLDQHGIVCAVQASCSCSLGSVTCTYRLAASHNTATAACHYLDQMIVGFTVLHTLHNRSGICKSASYTNVNIHSLVRNSKFFDSLIAAHAALCDFAHGLLGMIWA